MSRQEKVVPIVSSDNKRGRKDVKRIAVSLATLPAPLRKLQDKSRQALIKLLQGLFDSADDALFELADKALTNGEQNVYFESMRDVRLQRRSIEADFSQLIPETFVAIMTGQCSGSQNIPMSELSDESLSLVQNDELEERVAIDGMVAKLMSGKSDQLKMLCQRIDSLVPANDINESNVPVGPVVVCENFQKASSCLDVDIRSKLVLFKLFEKSVLLQLEPFYQEWNDLLAEQGVLPSLQVSDLKSKRARAAPKASQTSTTMPSGATSSVASESMLQAGNETHSLPAEVNHGAFANMQHMLAQQQGSVLAQDILKAASWFLPGASPELPQAQLLGMLGQAQAQQHSTMGSTLDRSSIDDWQAAPLDVHGTLKTMLAAENVNERRSLGQLEFDAINLVSMLFQFILDDGSLAEPMKALIAQLQIPLLKVAMLDSTFFGSGGHPARKLLNNIATAALGWTADGSSKRDPLLDKIESIVETLLQDFDEDLAIFDSLQQDFDVFLATEARRANLLEKRAVDAANGKARSHQARLVVQKKLGDRVLGRKLPVMVVQLLREAWSNVLFLACVKDGMKSDVWADALNTVDLLIWSVAENEPSRSRKELLQKMPELLKKLRMGLTQISYDPFKMNTQFTELEKIHLGILAKLADEEVLLKESKEKDNQANDNGTAESRTKENHANRNHTNKSHVKETRFKDGGIASSVQDDISLSSSAAPLRRASDELIADSAPPAVAKNSSRDGGIDHETTAKINMDAANSDEEHPSVHLSVDVSPQQDPATRQAAESLAPICDSTQIPLRTGADSAIAEIVEEFDILGEKEKQFDCLTATELSVESEYYEQAKALRVGSWVELCPPNEKGFRAKLAAITPPNDNYIFVNRSGMKVTEKPRLLVAAEFKSKQIILLDDSAIFDRALESVIGGLRSIKKPVA